MITATLTGLSTLSGCGSKFLKYEKESSLKKIDEFDKKVEIVIAEEPPEEPAAETPEEAETVVQNEKTELKDLGQLKTVIKTQKKTTAEKKTPLKRPSQKEAAAIKKAAAGSAAHAAQPTQVAKKTKRQPELETSLGFDGRRPLVDPFHVGEKVVHSVHYFGVNAGRMVLEVKPYAQVNGKKNYHFHIGISTSKWYSGIYSVDDKVTVLMDFETLVPSIFQLHVRESAQLREARMLFEGNQATYWERKVTDKNGEEEKRLNWEIEEYSQSVFSAAFYMRFFDWPLGVENAFRVADDNENLIFRGKAIRKEKLKTDVGTFNAVVVQPQIELKGKFKQVGDIFVWLSDDDRKFILKIESKIKIGTLVSELVELKKGNP